MSRILSFFAYLLLTLLGLVLLAGVYFKGYFYHQMYQNHQIERQLKQQENLKNRQELKAQCHSEHCECFNNIVDYRLSSSQVRSFLLYLKERQNRSETQLLEFTSLREASDILSILQICQPATGKKEVEDEAHSSESKAVVD